MSKFQTLLQGQVISELQAKPMSIAELAVKMGSNYHSTRQAVRILQQKGMIKSCGGLNVKNIKYELGQDYNENMEIIPSYDTINIFNLIYSHRIKADDSRGASAVLRLPHHITRIMQAARNPTGGELTLQVVREQLEQDKQAIEAIAHIMQSILDDPRNWNLEVVKGYVKDPAYKHEILDEAMEHYYPSD